MNETPEFYELYQAMKKRGNVQRIAEVSLWCLICFCALLGNSATLLVIAKNRRLWGSTNMLIACLAVFDLSMSVLNGLPFAAPSLAIGKWPFSYAACQYMGYSGIAIAVGSMQTISCIAVNRFYRVVRPTKFKRAFSVRSTAVYIVTLWVFALIAPLPYILEDEKFKFQPGKILCFPSSESGLQKGLHFIVLVLIPGTVICYCYLRVYLKVRQHMVAVTTSIGAEEIAITKTLVAIVLGYLCCWVPILAIDLVDFFIGRLVMPRWVYLLYGYLAMLSSVTSPVIYALLIPTFRREYLKLIKKIRKCNRVGNCRVEDSIETTEVCVISSKYM